MRSLPLKKVFTFSVPIILGQMGQMLFGTGDIFVAGRYSSEVVAALGVSTTIFSPFLMLGLGLTFAVSSITARLKGSGEKEDDMLFNALFVVTMAGVLIGGLLYLMTSLMPYLNLVPAVEKHAIDYLELCSISILPALWYAAYKEYLQAYSDTLIANGAILFFNVTNVGLNMIFMFGYGPIPEMGIKGAALATIITRLMMAMTLALYTKKRHPISFKINPTRVKEIISLGLPISLSSITEILVFTAVTVLAGKMSVLASASHNIVLNLSGLTFMVPLAMSSSASVFIGEQYGKKDLQGITDYALSCQIISILFMGSTALVFFLLPEPLIRMATPNPEIISYASGLLFYVALFQVPDGIQVTFWGILRGLGTTKLPMAICLIVNWCLGLPIGITMAREYKMEVAGLWAGLAIGLFFMSIGLSFVFIYRRRELKKEFIS